MRRKTTEEWVKEAELKHEGRFDYSESVYTGANKKLNIRCIEHGLFEQVANNHLQGMGCPKCGDRRKGETKVIDVAEFLRRSRAAHGDRYTYVESSYSSMSEAVDIVCEEHGLFSQIASVHAKGHGCPQCAKVRASKASRSTTEAFVLKARTIHGTTYDYSKASYVDNSTKVEIICSEHGSFWKTPANHLKGQGCPECARIEARLGLEAFILRANEVHGGKYDYTLVQYVTADKDVIIKCEKHGLFSQTPHSHLKGRGCPECAIESRSSNLSAFILKAQSAHGDKYDYSAVDYRHCEKKVKIFCSEHGEFMQTPANHLQKSGCPKCANIGPSKPQLDLAEFLSSLTETVLEHRVGRKRVDIFLPKHNIGVEYHGLIWHSEKFVKAPFREMLRHNEIESHGIRLIHVYSDEWAQKRPIVEKTLRSILGLNASIGARSCSLERPEWSEVKAFLDANHLQGAGLSRGMNYALRHKDDLVAVATFAPSRFGTGDWEILRFASSLNVAGGFSRLIKAFRAEHTGSLFSFSDNRWFTGEVYAKNGFVRLGFTEPGYFWTDGNSRVNRYATQKHKLKALFPDCDPDTQTEVQIMHNNGFHRVWDCGNTRWLLP
jgi:Zn finger protein HypA/HybF involved in hydrogenase expression